MKICLNCGKKKEVKVIVKDIEEAQNTEIILLF